jgi:hypothetical protein
LPSERDDGFAGKRAHEKLRNISELGQSSRVTLLTGSTWREHASGAALHVHHFIFVAEIVMKKPLVFSISMAGILSMAFAGGASARIDCGAVGVARIGSQTSCFNANFNTCGLTSSCSTDLLVPLTVDSFGPKSVSYSRNATAAGALCRVVSNNVFGTAPSATVFDPVPVSGACQSFTFPPVSVSGVLFLDCITNPGTNLCAVNYTP